MTIIQKTVQEIGCGTIVHNPLVTPSAARSATGFGMVCAMKENPLSKSATPQNQFLISFYPESCFGGFSDIDGTIAFYVRVNALITSDSVVVDFGCGRGEYGEDAIQIRRDLRVLKGKVWKVVGLDIDPAAAANPFLDEFFLLSDEGRWPLASRHADLVLCDNVLEHLRCPQFFFKEAARVLKPGGFVCIRTPNVLSYVGLISRAIPNRSLKYDQNLKPANVKSTTCAYLFVTEQAISATC